MSFRWFFYPSFCSQESSFKKFQISNVYSVTYCRFMFFRKVTGRSLNNYNESGPRLSQFLLRWTPAPARSNTYLSLTFFNSLRSRSSAQNNYGVCHLNVSRSSIMLKNQIFLVCCCLRMLNSDNSKPILTNWSFPVIFRGVEIYNFS